MGSDRFIHGFSQEAMTSGSAICAEVGCGQHSSLAEAAERMLRIGTEVQPNQGEKEVRDFHFQEYSASYPGLKDLVYEVSSWPERRYSRRFRFTDRAALWDRAVV